MSVLKGNNVSHSAGQEVFQYFRGGHTISDGPGIFIKPCPQSREYVRGKEVHMSIHKGRESFRDLFAFLII